MERLGTAWGDWKMERRSTPSREVGQLQMWGDFKTMRLISGKIRGEFKIMRLMNWKIELFGGF